MMKLEFYQRADIEKHTKLISGKKLQRAGVEKQTKLISGKKLCENKGGADLFSCLWHTLEKG